MKVIWHLKRGEDHKIYRVKRICKGGKRNEAKAEISKSYSKKERWWSAWRA